MVGTETFKPVPSGRGGDLKPVFSGRGGDLKPVFSGRDGDLKPVPSTEKTAKNPKGAEFSAPFAFAEELRLPNEIVYARSSGRA